MSVSAYTQWEVRSTGSDSNGGGFDPSVTSLGTDYSQQDSVQVTYTDLVIATSGSTSTITSVGNPFGSSHVGNVLRVTSGTGFTAGDYTITSVLGTTATVSGNIGTAASTGGNGVLGGGLLTPAAAINGTPRPQNGNIVYVKYGTYTTAASLVSSRTYDSTTGRWFRIIGYYDGVSDRTPYARITTAHRPVIKRGGSYQVVSNQTSQVLWRSFTFDCSSSANDGVYTNGFTAVFELCNTTNPNTGNVGFTGSSTVPPLMVECESKGWFSGFQLSNCLGCLGDCTGGGNFGSGFSNCNVYNCLATSGGTGWSINNTISNVFNRIENFVGYNSAKGIVSTGVTNMGVVRNALAHTCTVGFNGSAASNSSQTRYYACSTYNCATPVGTFINTDFLYDGTGSQATPISCSVDPCTNASGGDFSLNSTAGGGALLRGSGWGVINNSARIGYPDVGAIQHQDSGGGGGTTYVFSTMD